MIPHISLGNLRQVCLNPLLLTAEYEINQIIGRAMKQRIFTGFCLN